MKRSTKSIKGVRKARLDKREAIRRDNKRTRRFARFYTGYEDEYADYAITVEEVSRED